MKYAFTQILIIFTFLNCFSQSRELSGKWILVKTLFSNGKNIEINNPSYSTKTTLDISENSIKINDSHFEATFTNKQIKTPFRNLNYLIKENYLLTQDEQTDKINYFLKTEDFIKNYPEFSLKEIERDGKIILVDNEISAFEFDNDVSFDDFITTNTKSRNSKDFKNLYFQVEFILTKNNQIKDIKVLNSIDEEFDNNYIKALKKAAKYLKNKTGKDVLITKEVNEVKWGKDLTDDAEKKLFQYDLKGSNYFQSNDFTKAVEELSKIKTLDIKNHHFKITIEDSMKNLGISYLALGKKEEACKTFNEIGDKTDFEIRNFLIDFCEK